MDFRNEKDYPPSKNEIEDHFRSSADISKNFYNNGIMGNRLFGYQNENELKSLLYSLNEKDFELNDFARIYEERYGENPIVNHDYICAVDFFDRARKMILSYMEDKL